MLKSRVVTVLIIKCFASICSSIFILDIFLIYDCIQANGQKCTVCFEERSYISAIEIFYRDENERGINFVYDLFVEHTYLMYLTRYVLRTYII